IAVAKPEVQYQISYRKYDPGTAIRSFRWDDLIDQRASLERLSANLKSLSPPDLVTLAKSLTAMKTDSTPDIKLGTLAEPVLTPGEKRKIDLIEPPGTSSSRAIVQLRCQVQGERLQEALRTTLLTITFDGSATPQVRVPLGDFFGTAPGANAMTTLP